MPVKFTATNKETHRIKEMSAEELIFNYERFIKKIIFYYDKEGKYFDDLFQAAVLELLKCKENFDPEKGVFFCVYCKQYIMEKIKQEMSFLSVPMKMCYRTAYKYTKSDRLNFVCVDEFANVLSSRDTSDSMDEDEWNSKLDLLEEKINKSDLSEEKKSDLLRVFNKIKSRQFVRATIKPETLELFQKVLET